MGLRLNWKVKSRDRLRILRNSRFSTKWEDPNFCPKITFWSRYDLWLLRDLLSMTRPTYRPWPNRPIVDYPPDQFLAIPIYIYSYRIPLWPYRIPLLPLLTSYMFHSLPDRIPRWHINWISWMPFRRRLTDQIQQGSGNLQAPEGLIELGELVGFTRIYYDLSGCTKVY